MISGPADTDGSLALLLLLAADTVLRAPRIGRAERALALSTAAFDVPVDAYAEQTRHD